MKKQSLLFSSSFFCISLLALSSCSPSYLKFAIAVAPLKTNEQIKEPEIEIHRKEYILEQMKEDISDAFDLGDKTSNNLFSPVSFFQCVGEAALASKNGFSYVKDLGYTSLDQFKEEFDMLQKYFLYEDQYTYLKSLGFYCLYNIDKPVKSNLEKLASTSNLSSFSSDNLNNLLNSADEYLLNNAKIDFKIPSDIFKDYEKAVFAVNGLHIKDTFYKEKNTIRSFFTDLNGAKAEKDFIAFDEYGNIYKDETNKVYLVKTKVFATSLIYVLPFDGVNINDIKLDEIDLFDFYKTSAIPMQLTVKAPLFSNETGFTDYKSLLNNYKISLQNEPFDGIKEDIFDFPELFAYQKNKFELTKEGIEGKAVTIIGGGATSSAPVPEDATEIVIDRPFYCLSMRGDFPLFINKITNIA